MNHRTDPYLHLRDTEAANDQMIDDSGFHVIDTARARPARKSARNDEWTDEQWPLIMRWVVAILFIVLVLPSAIAIVMVLR